MTRRKRTPGKSTTCDVCGRKVRLVKTVHENIGDGCFARAVCAKCMNANGWKDGQYVEGPP